MVSAEIISGPWLDAASLLPSELLCSLLHVEKLKATVRKRKVYFIVNGVTAIYTIGIKGVPGLFDSI
jgi:hypothetical protein